MTELREKMTREMELRDFSPNTIDAYLSAVKGLAGFYMRSPDAIGQEEVEDYLLYLKKFKNYTASTRNQITCGLKILLQRNAEKGRHDPSPSREKGAKDTAEILSMDEVARLLQGPVKHQAPRSSEDGVFGRPQGERTGGFEARAYRQRKNAHKSGTGQGPQGPLHAFVGEPSSGTSRLLPEPASPRHGSFPREAGRNI